MTEPIFIAGWGSGPELFPRLSKAARFLSPFSSHTLEDIESLLDAGPRGVLMGWSTGAHLILKRLDRLVATCSHIILGAPFLSLEDSLPNRLTRAMLANLAQDPEQVLMGFHRYCGVEEPPPFDPAMATPLAQGLEYLLGSRVDPASLGTDCANVTVLHGAGDRVVRTRAVDALMAHLPGAVLHRMEGPHYINEAVWSAYLH